MELQQSDNEEVTLKVENIGGITETEVAFSPGVTVLAGRNATNRTSLLQALMAALGSQNVSIKGDAEDAGVELATTDKTYTRTLKRTGETMATSGSPYLEDAKLADLYAFLLESNEPRQAVAQGTDLREFIMRPVDTDEIQEDIERLMQKRTDLDTKLQEIESLKGDLPDLEAKRTRLNDDIEKKREELAAKEAELEAADADVEQTRDEKHVLEEKLGELSDLRAELDDVRYDIETESETLDTLTDEQQDLRATQAELPEATPGRLEDLNAKIERVRTRKQTIEPRVTELQSIITFNEDLLTADNHELLSVLEDDTDGSVTDQLVEDADMTCWTCGTTVAPEQIETTVEGLRELSQQKLSTVNELDNTLDDLTNKREELEDTQRKRDRVKRRLADIEDEIEENERAIEDLHTVRDNLIDDIKAVEAEVEDLESESISEILELHRVANQLEYEIGKLEGEMEQVEADIADIESRLRDREELSEERDNLQAEIRNLRTQIDRIEEESVTAFNDHMETVLGLLEYANLDRIWLERVEREVREGRQTVTKKAFELHIIRSTASGMTYEDTVDHLSESEREVTGLIFALAGYLAHDVVETVPMMLLDSLEALDADRIGALINYLSDHTEYLIVALLPDDAAALEIDHQKITPSTY